MFPPKLNETPIAWIEALNKPDKWRNINFIRILPGGEKPELEINVI